MNFHMRYSHFLSCTSRFLCLSLCLFFTSFSVHAEDIAPTITETTSPITPTTKPSPLTLEDKADKIISVLIEDKSQPQSTTTTTNEDTTKKKKKKKKHEKSTLGWIEDVIAHPGGIPFVAKLDSGAKTSSIDALHIERFFDNNEKQWVRFTVENAFGTRKTIERPVKRWVRIKKKGGGYTQRAVVIMDICIDGHYITHEMNLAKRTNFNYPVLIGRNMLAKHIVIDSSKRRTSKPRCEKK